VEWASVVGTSSYVFLKSFQRRNKPSSPLLRHDPGSNFTWNGNVDPETRVNMTIKTEPRLWTYRFRMNAMVTLPPQPVFVIVKGRGGGWFGIQARSSQKRKERLSSSNETHTQKFGQLDRICISGPPAYPFVRILCCYWMPKYTERVWQVAKCPPVRSEDEDGAMCEAELCCWHR
jgi:hypothetical protein